MLEIQNMLKFVLIYYKYAASTGTHLFSCWFSAMLGHMLANVTLQLTCQITSICFINTINIGSIGSKFVMGHHKYFALKVPSKNIFSMFLIKGTSLRIELNKCEKDTLMSPFVILYCKADESRS